MKKITFSPQFYSLIGIIFLSLSLSAISDIEMSQLINNSNETYVYCDKNHSNMADFVAEMSNLDKDKNSPICQLNEHIKKGFAIGKQDAIVDALIYAEEVLNENHKSIDPEQKAQFMATLWVFINEVIGGQLAINLESLFNETRNIPTRSFPCCPEPCHDKTFKLEDKIIFENKATFKDDVKFKDDVTFEDNVTFKDDVKFKDDVTFKKDVEIQGSLSVADQIIGTLSVNDAIITNLTATSLSATDAIIANGIVNNLSATDAVIANLTITNCIPDLCVSNLSVVNESISGILSATDIAAATIDVDCDLTVGCNIIMNSSVDATIGNIFKNGTQFMHNYGINNTFVGLGAGNFTTTGQANTSCGALSLPVNASGLYNTGMGGGTLMANVTGDGNTACGTASLLSNVSGNINTAVGFICMISHVSGDMNTAVGSQCMNSHTTGANNVAVGSEALSQSITGSDNIAVGCRAGNFLVNGDNNIYVGNNGMTTESDTIRIGNTQTACFIAGINGATATGGIAVYVDGSNQLGTLTSSARYKHNIQDMAADSSDIYKLRPVTFAYNNDATETKQYGLIAEEVAHVFPEMVVYDADGQAQTVQYQVLPTMILNELQKQQATIDTLIARVDRLEQNAPAA